MDARYERGQRRWTYLVQLTCGNCRESFTLDIPLGEPVRSQSCPNCGCRGVAAKPGARL